MATNNSSKPRIGIFGRCNVGKSTLINYLTLQQTAIVSPEAGTTTDPVRKTMEITGVGPVVLTDTAGLDDESEMGQQRVGRTMDVLPDMDVAILLYRTGCYGVVEQQVEALCQQHSVELIRVQSYADTDEADATADLRFAPGGEQWRQPLIEALKKRLQASLPQTKPLLEGCIAAGDAVVLVTPIDASAPEGRMILPQVRVLRTLMDAHARAMVCQPQELTSTLAALREPPRLVVTDSQAFGTVAAAVPSEVALTSFSMVLAAANPAFGIFRSGTERLADLNDGDRVLILEACTHSVNCGDIGREKLPTAITKATGRELVFSVRNTDDTISFGTDQWAAVIICGGCMTTPRRISRLATEAAASGAAVSNYGMTLAWCNKIFNRSIAIFAE